MPKKLPAAAATTTTTPSADAAAGSRQTRSTVQSRKNSPASFLPSVTYEKPPEVSQTQQQEIVFNELLSFVVVFRRKTSADTLRRCIAGHFNPSEITDAKQQLVEDFKHLVENPLLTERRNVSDVEKRDAEIDDILGAVDVLSVDGSLLNVQLLLVASRLCRMPLYIAEENIPPADSNKEFSRLNDSISSLSSELKSLKLSLDIQVENYYATFQSVQSNASKLQEQIDNLSLSLTSQFDNVNHVNNSVNSDVDMDRSMNIIVYGIAEDKDMTVWRRSLDDVLKYIVGRDVDVVDLFRLGRFHENKKRPILVKLRTVWDRRVILHSCWKLKQYREMIYVWEDEPLEVRRGKIFQRIKHRAERENKMVIVDNDLLIIDNVPVFSLTNGHISHE